LLPDPPDLPDLPDLPDPRPLPARELFLQRRSAVAFDARTGLSSEQFFHMLRRTLPQDHAPWQALSKVPRIHLLLFVHRVADVAAGLYVLGRSRAGADRLFAAMGRDFSSERVHDSVPLVRLATGECRSLARRLSCDQDIAADGCFSVGMLAEFDAALEQDGPASYRRLFWEAGVVGQVLYLEAEAAGLRGTGIGCFYDDPVHEVLGLSGHTFQSLYHFTVGGPVEDRRISAEPGYEWEDNRVPAQSLKAKPEA
jgi:nitroreductase